MGITNTYLYHITCGCTGALPPIHPPPPPPPPPQNNAFNTRRPQTIRQPISTGINLNVPLRRNVHRYFFNERKVYVSKTYLTTFYVDIQKNEAVIEERNQGRLWRHSVNPTNVAWCTK